MARRYKELVAHGLLLTVELTRLVGLFRQIGIEILPYKGPTLALELYGSIGLRQFTDLDFLIHANQAHQVFGALQQWGFAQVYPSPSVHLSDYRLSSNEYVFSRGGGRIVLEPHWAVLPPTLAIDLDMGRIWSRTTNRYINNVCVRTLCPEDLLIVLCVHAFKHRFVQLKWIVDIALLLQRFPELDWTRLRSEAKTVGTERIILIGVMLAYAVVGAQVPLELRLAAIEDRCVGPLVDQVSTRIFEPPRANDPFEISAFYWYARERWHERTKYVLRTAFTPRSKHLAIVPLPLRLHWMYWFLKPLHDYVALPCWKMLKWIGLRKPKKG